MYKILFMVIGFTLMSQAAAAPGVNIARMMQTPASAFDMFLFRLYEAAKCNKVVKNSNLDEADLCLSSLSYNADKNILSAFVRILPGAEIMDDFVDLEPEGRKEIMLKVLANTARRIGAVDSWGLLHSTPIGHGDAVAVAEQKSFRAELANRTATALSTSYDGVVYIATRHPGGRVEYFTSK